MPMSGHSSRRLLASLSGLAVAATGLSLAPFPAHAAPDGSGVVISEVYGAGGNNGARYSHDFVELYNPTAAPIDVSAMSIQYRATASTGVAGASNVSSLAGAGSLAPGDHLVVRLGTGNAAIGVPVPGIDVTPTTAQNLGGTNGQVFLASTTTAIDPDGAGNVAVTDPRVVDFVGFGTASIREGGAAAPAPTSSTVSITRDATGTDTDVNGADFTVADPPTPGAPAVPAEPEVPVEPTAATIREIQGTGSASDLVGLPVITRGVVTAAPRFLYGFFLQTPGSGGESARTGSDGIFVYYPNGSGQVTVAPGDHVEVTGEVGEYAGQTQVVTSQAQVRVLTETAAAPVAYTGEWPDTAAEKEALEGMLVRPQGEFTVADNYSTNLYGEVGLARGDKPLLQPTEVADAQDAAAIAAVVADNAARAITLDDGSSTDFGQNQGLTPSYVSNTAPVRVGASVRFTEDVVLSQGGSPSAPTYRFQPLQSIDMARFPETSPAQFENTRTAAPDPTRVDPAGEAELRIASFNVLNYFTTLGDADDDNVGDGGCRSYADRAGDGNNVSSGCDQRGAWDPADFQRQQEKIVAAINALDADVVGLMEIENSLALGEPADEATRSLVAALNAAAGSEVWAANPSSSDLPPAAEMDVITNAIIYKPAAVARTGEARALGTLSGAGGAFDNAREPIAQAFTPKAGGEPFLFVVNHFKSKGSGEDDGTGQGNANPDRVRQATALGAWVEDVQTQEGVEATYLLGDFNAYSQEDPMQVLDAAGYADVESVVEGGEYSYLFGGLVGSLDHVLANDAALATVTGADIWNINSVEPISLEYSRFNYHGTDFHQPTPYRSSDHDPIVVGIDTIAEPTDPEPVTPRITAFWYPKRVVAGTTRAMLTVKVSARGEAASGWVRVAHGSRKPKTAKLVDGMLKVRLWKFDGAGDKTLRITYNGRGDVAAKTVERVLTVVKRR